MKYILWDKKSEINGVQAKEILSMQPQLAHDKEVVLEVTENTNKVTRIESVDLLRGICNAPDDVGALDIIPYFDNYINKENEQSNQNAGIVELQDDSAFIAETLAIALEEIELLKTEISALKGAQ